MKYTKEIMEKACEGALSLAQVCRNLGIKPAGGNYHTVRVNLDKYGIDTSHFTGQRWNKGLKHLDKASIYPLEEVLKENINYKSSDLKQRLIVEGLKENKCEICGYTENLELHHINGNHFDNRIDNLQILCPNCHAKTDNYRGRNSNKNTTPENLSKKYHKDHYCTCKNCNKVFYSDRTDRVRKFCSRECYMEYLQKLKLKEVEPLQGTVLNPKIIITEESLKEKMKECSNFTELSEIFGVSRPTIQKYAKIYGLYEEFKYKYNFHAKAVGQYDLKGNLIKEWPSMSDAAKEIKCSVDDISKVCKHKRRSAKGYLWKYLE